MITNILGPENLQAPPSPELDVGDKVVVGGKTYKLVKLLGEGATGKVFEGHSEHDGHKAAVKVMKLAAIAPDLDDAKREVKEESTILAALGKVRHESLPDYYGTEIGQENAIISLELISGEPLDEIVRRARPLDQKAIYELIRTVGSGLAQLHRPPLLAWSAVPLEGNALIHGDIKPGNIILAHDGHYFLVDYGIASATHHARQVKQDFASKTDEPEGTLPYADPVFAATKRYLPSMDVYSFAATILDLALDKSISEIIADQGLSDNVVLDPRKPLLQELVDKTTFDPKLKQVLKDSLSLDLKDRPVDMRDFLHRLGEKRRFWHADFDGKIEFDLEWIELFPKEVHEAVMKYASFIETVLVNPGFDSNEQITVDTWFAGRVVRALRDDYFTTLNKQIEIFKDLRDPLTNYWQKQSVSPTGASRAIAEFLTYTDALLASSLRSKSKAFDKVKSREVVVSSFLDSARDIESFPASSLKAHVAEEALDESPIRIYLSNGHILDVQSFQQAVDVFKKLSYRHHQLAERSKDELREISRQLEQLRSMGGIITPRLIASYHRDFIQDFFRYRTVEPRPIAATISDRDYEALRKDIAPDRLGEYTVDLEMLDIDWERLSKGAVVKALSFPEMVGRPTYEVLELVAKRYKNSKVKFPGLELWRWLVREENHAPLKAQSQYFPLRSGDFCYLIGSLIRDSDGKWQIPATSGGTRTVFTRNARSLDSRWDSDCRIVVLEEKS